MDKLKIGQVLYSLNVGNMARHSEQKLSKVIVTKVGRKYFTCKDEDEGRWSEVQYCLDNWCEKTDYSADSVLYSSPQEWENEKESRRLCKLIYKEFEYGHNRKGLSLVKLKMIEQIMVA